MMQNRVPFVDLALQHARIASNVQSGLERVLKDTSFILGPEVEAFEQAFSAYCGVAHTVGVANGTDALEIALTVAGIGPGDEVILPANTFVATAEAVARVGADVVLADCDEDFLMDSAELERHLTPRTRCVIAVHLYGQVAPVEEIRSIVGPDILILEDAAQSQGASRHGVRAGSLGDIAATSFYPGKNLGAYGDAGAVMTDNDRYDVQARALRNHGGLRKYEHDIIGRNSRLDGLQGAVLTTKLAVLNEWNGERRAAAHHYSQMLGGTERVITPRTKPGNEHVFHLYVVRVPRRDHVLEQLGRAEIGAGIHYPIPIHRHKAFAHLQLGPGSYPRTETIAGEILSLPMFPGITARQQERVVEVLLGAVR